MMIYPVLCQEETVSLSSYRGLLLLLQLIVIAGSIVEAGTLAGMVLRLASIFIMLSDLLLFICQRSKSRSYCECVGPSGFHNIEIFIETDKQALPL